MLCKQLLSLNKLRRHFIWCTVVFCFKMLKTGTLKKTLSTNSIRGNLLNSGTASIYNKPNRLRNGCYKKRRRRRKRTNQWWPPLSIYSQSASPWMNFKKSAPPWLLSNIKLKQEPYLTCFDFFYWTASRVFLSFYFSLGDKR